MLVCANHTLFMRFCVYIFRKMQVTESLFWSCNHNTYTFRKIRVGGRGPCTPWLVGPAKRGVQIWLRTLGYRHTRTELTKNWFHTFHLWIFLYLSNTSKKLMFPQPIVFRYLSQSLLIAKYIVGSFVVSRAGLKPMQRHWAPRHGVWVD